MRTTGITSLASVGGISGGVDSGFGTAVALTGDTAFIGAPRLFIFGMRIGLVARHDRANDGSWPFVTYKISRRPEDSAMVSLLAIAASTTLLTALDNGPSTRPAGSDYFTALAISRTPTATARRITAITAKHCITLTRPTPSRRTTRATTVTRMMTTMG
ncbi:MAG: hypothetical protein IPG64_08765 [Haliea sp.]|nr:hypothetical protein [Haliea sp.]